MNRKSLIGFLLASVLLAAQASIGQANSATVSKDNWCVFKDALRNPIPQAEVAIFGGVSWSRYQSSVLEVSKLDEKGRLKPPSQDPNLQSCCFVVSHPDYGIALAEPRWINNAEGPLTECIVPLVRKDAEEHTRSIWGRVIDREGNFVPSAIISCRGLEAVGGGAIRFSSFDWQTVRSITDQQGQFNLCIPVNVVDGQIRLVPQGVKYYLGIEAPEELRLPNYYGTVPSGQESTIVMGPRLLEHREFIFGDEFGPISDPNMLQQVRYEFFGEGSHRGRGLFSEWLQRAEFKQDTYYTTAIWNGKYYTFEPLKLTDESPEKVVFKPAKIEPADRIYRGQVIHGVTGQPIADAIVMRQPDVTDVNISEHDVSEIEAIRQIGPEIELDDPIFEMLKEDFKSRMISITDSGGNFQLVVTKGGIRPMHHIIAIKKDFMGAKQQFSFPSRGDANSPIVQDWFVPDRNGYVTIPPLKLYPAGTIIIEPNLPIESRSRRIRLSWFNFPGYKPPWFEAMGDYTYPSKNTGASLFYKKDLLLNTEQKVYVAAELEMTLQIYVLDGPGRGELDPIVIPNIKLHQGEVLNLGRVEFGPALKVAVKVVDSSGRGVEGVIVRHKDETGLFGGREGITDADGIALLNIPRYSRGEFVVEKRFERSPDGSWPEPLREGISYKIAGQEDADKVFTLQLSDQFLKILFE